MKAAITGKGGVGKTTFAATLARLYADEGRTVLAADLGITNVRVVANKVRGEDDEQFIRSKVPEEDLLGFIHYNPEIIDADRRGVSPYDASRTALEEIRRIKMRMDNN